ncbi:MAG: sigma-70 family RNA polymerase sigma factor [Archangium gephyra]|uniref:Sigma-70 family RNA polymerase sigma factor n=1 Tax=Archangium gephyra TaxID=48 RepID=A0A2W5TJQ4_9BACT|nr:MAG: sigma-70 family RNA polymerase sigma factor [Archangium gephyra]
MNKQVDVSKLYAKFGPAIYARCNRLLRNQAAAEDATQDVFMKVLKHIDSAPGEDAVLPWIHRITTNHCLNVIRDSRRHAEPVEHVPELVDDEFEDSVVTADFARRVIAKTPEALLAPAVMYHARGVEQARVAAALGVSRRTVLYRLAEFTQRAMRMQELAEA